MKIFISYLKVDEDKKCSIELKPDEYFDPLDEGENYWEHGVDKYLSINEYLSISPRKLKWIEVRKVLNSSVRLHRIQHLDGDNTMTQHTIDEYGREELIISSLIAKDTYHTARSIKKAGSDMWSTYVNVIDEDGAEYNSTQLIKNWSFDELKDFS